jgi:hypothetical protein
MRKVAPDVERLMWLVAEERDPRAISDFEARFPDLKLELAKHIAMVSGLKNGARKVPPHEIPRFVPRYAQPRPIIARPALFAVALAACALVFGSVAIANFLVPKPPKPPPVEPVNAGPLVTPGIKVQPSTGGGSGSSGLPNPQTNTPSNPDVAQAEDPMDKPVTLRIDHAPLDAAVMMVCRQAGLIPEIPAGFPRFEVSMDYQGQSAGQILADLGAKNGFTALPQERGHVLFIPVRPDGTLKTPTAVPLHPETQGGKG